jgi:hypothetical protein
LWRCLHGMIDIDSQKDCARLMLEVCFARTQQQKSQRWDIVVQAYQREET